MNIVTRGFGPRQSIVTRGYGRSVLERIYREIIKLSTTFSRTARLNTSFNFAVRLITAVNRNIRLITGIGGTMGLRLATTFSRSLRLPTVAQLGGLVLSNIFKVASRIVLACRFDLRSRDE